MLSSFEYAYDMTSFRPSFNGYELCYREVNLQLYVNTNMKLNARQFCSLRCAVNSYRLFHATCFFMLNHKLSTTSIVVNHHSLTYLFMTSYLSFFFSVYFRINLSKVFISSLSAISQRGGLEFFICLNGLNINSFKFN